MFRCLLFSPQFSTRLSAKSGVRACEDARGSIASVFLRPRNEATAATRAFSLVELLVVLAVMAILIYLTFPAIGSILQSRTFAGGLYDVSGLLQLARSEAVSRHTYVWVGFANNTVSNRPEL